MPSYPIETKEPLDAGLSEAQIKALIAERKASGAENCRVLVEQPGNKRFLVCLYPPL